MATKYEITTDRTTALELDDGDEAIIHAGVTLDTTGTPQIYGIYAHASGSTTITVNGTVEAARFGMLLGKADPDHHDIIQIGASGKVLSDDYGLFLEDASTVTSAGTIAGVSYGIWTSNALTFNNSGTVQARGNAIHCYAGKLDLTNTGTILSTGSGSYGVFGSDEGDIVRNSGRIESNEGIFLGLGNDLYDGRGGTMTGLLLLEDGDDVAYGGAGRELFFGGDGNDTLDGGAGDDDLDGGDGIDTARYSGPAAAYVDLSISVRQNTIGHGQDLLIGIENLEGGSGNDRFTGNAGVNRLVGNDGDDTLDGGAGADQMEGGAGNDAYYVDDAADVVSETASGGTADLIYTAMSYSLVAHVENLFALGSSAITLNGNTLNNRITGNSASNILNGDAGDDVLDGAAGADYMAGGVGNDTYYVDNAWDQVVESASEGTDLVHTSISHTLVAHVENLTASGTGWVSLTGNDLANTITGNTGRNTIKAGYGNDKIYGGYGNDTLYGQSGKDTFVFNTKLSKYNNVDKIADYNKTYDTIYLENAIFKKLTKTGTLKKSYFTVGTKAADANDYIVYNSKTGYLYYDADGSGKGGAIAFAKLAAGLKMAYSEFKVI